MQTETQGNRKSDEGNTASIMEHTVSAVTSNDGTTIGYRQYGRGPGVILVRGAMGTAHNYDQLARARTTDSPPSPLLSCVRMQQQFVSSGGWLFPKKSTQGLRDKFRISSLIRVPGARMIETF
jgi:hypothetical protein